MEVLDAVGATERANYIQPVQSIAIVGVHGHSYRVADAPLRDVHAQAIYFLKQPLVEKRMPCKRLERVKRAQHRTEKKASTICKAQLHTLTTLDARGKLCRVQRLLKHMSNKHPYPMEDILVLLLIVCWSEVFLLPYPSCQTSVLSYHHLQALSEPVDSKFVILYIHYQYNRNSYFLHQYCQL